ncbi:MAG: HTH-type transcriptional regulator/antitoxin MqsA [Phenylobacterium sp.]|jgi:HTH-type transcriptional regulator/antitoxin MqsA
MSAEHLCPICEAGQLSTHTEQNTVEYKGETTALTSHYSLCDGCGAQQSDALQLRTNKRLMAEFKKQVDGLLTGKEVRAIRQQLSLTQADAASLFGGGPVAFSKYEADDVAQSDAMDKLLRVASAVPAAFAYLTEQLPVTKSM